MRRQNEHIQGKDLETLTNTGATAYSGKTLHEVDQTTQLELTCLNMYLLCYRIGARAKAGT